MKPPFTADYDADADVLYIRGGENRAAIASDVANGGVLLRFAADNGELVGITVMDASRLTREICKIPLKNIKETQMNLAETKKELYDAGVRVEPIGIGGFTATGAEQFGVQSGGMFASEDLAWAHVAAYRDVLMKRK